MENEVKNKDLVTKTVVTNKNSDGSWDAKIRISNNQMSSQYSVHVSNTSSILNKYSTKDFS